MGEFKKGDVVQLKSGGPKMTISGNSRDRMSGKTLDDRYDVVFFDEKNEPVYREFDESVLKLADED